MSDEGEKAVSQMAVRELRERLTDFYGLLPPQPVRERFLVATHEPLIAPQYDPCGDM